MNISISRICGMLLAGAMLVGCIPGSETRRPVTDSPSASADQDLPGVSSQPAPLTRIQQVQAALKISFPSSSVKPAGKPWKIMNPNGYTGGIAEMCQKFGLTAAECVEYQTQRTTSQCWADEVPNGIVLDDLLFTKSGEHLVQHQVLVSLENPPSKQALLCRVGKSIIVHFLGCGNYGRVRNVTLSPSPRPPQQAVEPVPQPTPSDREVLVFHHFRSTQKAVELKKGAGDSRHIGREVRQAAARGEASRVNQCYPFGVEFLDIGSTDLQLLLDGKALSPVKREGSIVRYEFAACGEMSVSFPPGFVNRQTWFRIPREFTKGYYYPLGFFSTKPGELYDAFRKEGSPQDALFVIGAEAKPLS